MSGPYLSLLTDTLFFAREDKKEERMAPILKLDDHDEEKEIEFELSYLLSLTLQERFQLMFKKTKEMLDLFKEKWTPKA
jgi:hypothetical protein